MLSHHIVADSGARIELFSLRELGASRSNIRCHARVVTTLMNIVRISGRANFHLMPTFQRVSLGSLPPKLPIPDRLCMPRAVCTLNGLVITVPRLTMNNTDVLHSTPPDTFEQDPLMRKAPTY